VRIMGYGMTPMKRGTLFVMLRGRLLRNGMNRMVGEIRRRRSARLGGTRRGASWSGPDGWRSRGYKGIIANK
jgi:hypothetical protein